MVRDARMAVVAVAVATLGLAGCGGGTSGAVTSTKVGALGGTVQLAGSGLSLEVPPGALETEVEIELREVEARHGSREFEVAPSGTQLAIPARLKLEGTASDDRIVEIEGEIEKQLEHEREQDGVAFAEVRHFGTFALAKREDGQSYSPTGTVACVPECAAGLECDDGACKAHDGSTDTGYWGANSGGVNAGKDDGTASDHKSGGTSGKKGGGYW